MQLDKIWKLFKNWPQSWEILCLDERRWKFNTFLKSLMSEISISNDNGASAVLWIANYPNISGQRLQLQIVHVQQRVSDVHSFWRAVEAPGSCWPHCDWGIHLLRKEVLCLSKHVQERAFVRSRSSDDLGRIRCFRHGECTIGHDVFGSVH